MHESGSIAFSVLPWRTLQTFRSDAVIHFAALKAVGEAEGARACLAPTERPTQRGGPGAVGLLAKLHAFTVALSMVVMP